jgi:hypothetical protein
LNIIFPSSNLIEDIISQNLVVLNNAADLNLLNSIGDFKDFGVGVPDKPVDFKSKYLLSKALKIKACFIDLDFKHNNRFGNWLLLLRLCLFFRLWLLDWSCRLIISEKIDFLLLFDFLLGWWGMSLSPSFQQCWGERGDK